MRLKKVSKNLILLALLASAGTQAFAQDCPPCRPCPRDEEFTSCPAIEDIQQDPSGDNLYTANVKGLTWSGKVKGALGPIDSLRSATAIPGTGIDFGKPYKLYCSYNTSNHGILYLYLQQPISDNPNDFFKQPGWNAVVSCLSSQNKCEFKLLK